MIPIPFKESNLNLGAGDNPNTDDMPVAISKQSATGETPYSVSNWKLSPEELEEINRTGCLWVATMGWPPPPICIMGHNPFKSHGYTALDLTA